VEVAKKDNGSAWTSLSQGGSAAHVCATNAASFTYCWGEGASGQLGNGIAGAGTRSATPVLVKTGLNGFSGLVSVTVGETNSCGRKATGDTFCWGEDSMGQLGDGARIQKSTPAGVIAHTFTKITSGDGQSCGIDASQDIYCWGPNVLGQLGIGTRNSWLDQYSNGVTTPTKVVAPIP
jgi:alpha-tubulin suppressor-like RCC1 family protein